MKMMVLKTTSFVMVDQNDNGGYNKDFKDIDCDSLKFFVICKLVFLANI